MSASLDVQENTNSWKFYKQSNFRNNLSYALQFIQLSISFLFRSKKHAKSFLGIDFLNIFFYIIHYCS